MKKYLYPPVVVAALAIVFICCLNMMSHIEDRLFVSVDKFNLSKTDNITIGNNSDICYDKIPNDYISVSFMEDKDSAKWEVNPRYLRSDSLCYVKINESNPNIHDSIKKDGRIRIHHNSIDLEMNISELLNEIDEKCQSEYIAIKWLLAHRQARDTSFYHGHDFMDDDWLNSFIYRKRTGKWLSTKMGDPKLVILDNATTLFHEDSLVRFNSCGSVPVNEGVKIQFCKITASSYKEKKVKEEYFHIGDINYIMKPVIVTTEWGAGHIMLKRKNRSVDVLFPKPIIYIETIRNLDSLARFSSNVITFRQTDRLSLITNDLFFPTFSKYLNQDVCAIVFDSTSSSIKIDNSEVAQQRGFLPLIDDQQSSINPDVNLRMGIIGQDYFHSFLWLPLMVFLACSLLLFFLFNTDRLRMKRCKTAQSLRLYSLIILSVAFIYCVCRILIAIKLSYTYPFFDKIAGIITISTSAFLLLVFNLSLVINYKVLSPSNLGNEDNPAFLKLHRKWWALGASVVLLIGVGYCLVVMDKTNNAPFLESYLSDENVSLSPFSWKKLNPISWGKMNAMNDLHRNVPFMLLFANLLTILVLLVLNIKKWVKAVVDWMVSKIKKIAVVDWMVSVIKNIVDWMVSVIKKIYERIKVWGRKWKVVLLMAETILFAVPIFLCSLLPGNFATVLITLLLIPLLSVLFSHIPVDEKKGYDWRFLLAAGLSAAILVGSALLIGDKGYITNAVGILVSIMVIYCLLKKEPVDVKQYKWNKIIPWVSVLLLFVLFGVSLKIITSSDRDIYQRYNQRAGYNVAYHEYLSTGYRSALNSSEFMHVLTHYMYNTDGSDPLSPETHPLHSSVSTGQSPVILNDVSVPGAFIGAYGRIAFIPYLGLALLLLVIVLYNTYSDNSDISQRYPVLARYKVCRTIAVFMWVGTTLYLFFSYINVPAVPFTGRLNPGLGVDSVGESLESAVLLAFMLLTNINDDK